MFKIPHEALQANIVVGFDGFIDTITSVVKTRASKDSYTLFQTMGEFAEAVHNAGSKSSNFELVVKTEKIGGNGPILAQGLTSFGFKPTLIGALGQPFAHPLFTPLIQQCKEAFSLTNPGTTEALEFTDGKLLLGKHQPILEISKELLLKYIQLHQLKELFNQADIFASVNWTMILEMNNIWEYLLEDILPTIAKKPRKLFVDLADPAKRSDQDLQQACNLLKQFTRYYEVFLGLNQREAERLADVLYCKQDTLKEQAVSLQKELQIDVVIIHTKKQVVAASKDAAYQIDTIYCQNPIITTGCGDTFNAGFLAGIASKLSLQDCLSLGVKAASSYVKTGKIID